MTAEVFLGEFEVMSLTPSEVHWLEWKDQRLHTLGSLSCCIEGSQRLKRERRLMAKGQQLLKDLAGEHKPNQVLVGFCNKLSLV